MNQRVMETIVGFFILLAIAALLGLALKVSGITHTPKASSYLVNAEFDNIGSLTVGAPVSIAGVKVGEVSRVVLDPKTFRANVRMQIFSSANQLPVDSSASIYTAGLLGAQYISITPGFSTENLKQGSQIESTRSALVLEKLIGQFLFNMKDKK
jgi:phospholipid/cholesterol/gamma-HCH transport system substrate-binding protein